MEHLNKLGLDPALNARIAAWLTEPYDSKTREEVASLIESGKTTELVDAFYKDLEFGTGGLRGIVGIGTNRMNRYTVRRATQGFSNYLRRIHSDKRIRVVISYDSRHFSREFAQLTAEVFAANGIDVFIFREMRPTPLLSFAIRTLGCDAGVMMTASHNPREYNGYKAYWNDGGQLVAPHDRGVIAEVLALADSGAIKTQPTEGTVPGRISWLEKEMDEAYIQAVSALSLRPEIVQQQPSLPIVFSPIHGTGMTLVPAVLEKWGFTRIHVVPEQSEPDGDFPTVVYPNPEEAEAMTLSLVQARAIGAELALATDPDADRVGLATRTASGDYHLLNGNEIGSLLVDYVLSSLAEKGRLRSGDYVVKTIVTTGLIQRIADAHGVRCDEVLTGFKYIGELMTRRESDAGSRFVVGGEESFGYLIGDLVRDKDAVISCAFIAEMAAYHRSRGKSLLDALTDLYLQHGYYKERLISLVKTGKAGAESIRQIMDRLRTERPTELSGIPVAQINDYQFSRTYYLPDGRETALDLPQSNVLQFITADGDVISIRPSGTEPKIKFYCSAREPLRDREAFGETGRQLSEKIDRIMEAILRFDR